MSEQRKATISDGSMHSPTSIGAGLPSLLCNVLRLRIKKGET